MPNIQSALQGGELSSEEGANMNGEMADDVSSSPMIKTQNDGQEMFYDAGADEQDQDDLDDDTQDDDDLIDDDIIDEEAQLELQKTAIDRANSFDSESNASPLPNQKKIRSLRHAATLAADGQEHRSQNFDTEQKAKPNRGSSHPLGGSHTGKMMQAKKTKLMAVQDPSTQHDEGTNDQYSPRNVVAKMLMKKDRKIPGSVYKPHSEEIILLQSVALGQPQPSARVFFPYPKYCLKGEEEKQENTAAAKQN